METETQDDAGPKPEPEADDAVAVRPSLSRKAFLERVAERSGHPKRAEVRAIVEAALAVLGEALAEGSDAEVAPLGRLRVVKSRETERARVLTLRLSVPKRERRGGRGGQVEVDEEQGPAGVSAGPRAVRR